MGPPLPSQLVCDAVSAWGHGAIVEFCVCASSGCWLPALVVSANSETLVIYFLDSGMFCELSLHQSDERLAPIGTHEQQPPPGFGAVQSHSRPGRQSYLDQMVGVKYASLELVWRVHLERELQKAGCSTMSVLPGDDLSSKCFLWPTTCDSPEALSHEAKTDLSGSASHLECSPAELAEPDIGLAPSPSVVPMTKFAPVCSSTLHDPKIPKDKPFQQGLPTGGIDATATGECSAAFIVQRAAPKYEQRIAELEGALDESRDYVKLLESELRKKGEDDNTQQSSVFNHSHDEPPERSLSVSESAPTLLTGTPTRKRTPAVPRTCSPRKVGGSASKFHSAARTSRPTQVTAVQSLPRARTPPRCYTPVRGSSTGRLPVRSSTPSGSIRSSTPSGSPPSSSARSMRSSTPSGSPPLSSSRCLARSGTPSGSPRSKDVPMMSIGPRWSCPRGPPGKPSSGLTPRWSTSYQTAF